MLVYTAVAQGLIDPRNWTIKALIAARLIIWYSTPPRHAPALNGNYGDLFSELLIRERLWAKVRINPRGRPEQHYALLLLKEMELNLLQWAEHRFEEKRHLSRSTTRLPTQEMIAALEGEAERVAREVLAQPIPAAKDTAISAWLAREDFGKLARSLLNPHLSKFRSIVGMSGRRCWPRRTIRMMRHEVLTSRAPVRSQSTHSAQARQACRSRAS